MGQRSHRRNPLTDWIRSNLANVDYGQATALLLVYEQKGMDEEVQKVKLVGQTWGAEELAERLYTIAREHVKDDRGVEHRFRLLAFYDNDEKEPKITKRFNIIPYGEDGDVTLQDAPDARGQLAQGMRLTETLVQGAFKMVAQVTGSAAAELSHLREKNMEMFEMLQNMAIRVADADHEREMKRMTFERDTQERAKWMSFAPFLINTILGKEVFPQSSVDSSIVEAAAEHLSEDDLQGLASKLPPHLWGPLAARLESHLKAKTEKEKERQKILAAPGNTEIELGSRGE